MAERAKPRKITVESGQSDQQAITVEGEATDPLIRRGHSCALSLSKRPSTGSAHQIMITKPLRRGSAPPPSGLSADTPPK